jgi:hypothetical protein
VVAHASHLYGSLAVVIGLLAWIYFGAQLTLDAAEIDVVLAERLWPRSLRGLHTDADRRAFVLQANAVRRSAGEVITVTLATVKAERARLHGLNRRRASGGTACRHARCPPHPRADHCGDRTLLFVR